MLYLIFLLLILISLSNCTNVCDPRLPLCSPTWDETWYHYNNYTFSRNENNIFFIKNNITSFDLHLLTFDTTPNVKRTIKSWFNLTQPNLAVRVTDNWFPSSLPSGSANRTWTFFVFLLDHNSSIDPTHISVDQAFVEFKVVQSAPQPVTIDYKPLKPWIIALIVVSCVLVVSAMGIAAWWWRRRMEKKAVLSRPDAMLIADKFREVMSTSDLAQRNEKNAQDLLQRQLQAEEGTSIIEIRQSGSTINK